MMRSGRPRPFGRSPKPVTVQWERPYDLIDSARGRFDLVR